MLQLDAICLDGRQVVCELRSHRDAVFQDFAAGEGRDLEHRCVDLQALLPGRRLLDQGPYPLDHVAGAHAVADDVMERLPHLLQIGRLRAQPVHPGLCVGHGGGDRLTDLMRDRSGELAKRTDAVGVCELHHGFAIAPFALAGLGFRPLEPGQIEDETDALIAVLFEHRPTDHHGDARAVLVVILLLEWVHDPVHFEHCDVARVEVMPLRGSQLHAVQTTRREILAVVSYDPKERIIGLENLAFDLPDDDADDVGIEQAPDLLVPLFQIAVEPDVLLGRPATAPRFEPRQRHRRRCECGDDGDGCGDQPSSPLIECFGVSLPIHERLALIVRDQVDLRPDIVHGAAHGQCREAGSAGCRLDHLVDLAKLGREGQGQVCGTKTLQRVAGQQGLQALGLSSHVLVGNAVGLEIGRVESEQIPAPLSVQVDDDRAQPVERLEHLPGMLDREIYRLPVLPIAEAEKPAGGEQRQKHRAHQQWRTHQPSEDMAGNKD